MKALGHTFVDVLKVDIEGAEFASFLDVDTYNNEKTCFWKNLPLEYVLSFSLSLSLVLFPYHHHHYHHNQQRCATFNGNTLA